MTFTIIGFYGDSKQRFAEIVTADDLPAAEKAIFGQFEDGNLYICGAIEGEHAMADLKYFTQVTDVSGELTENDQIS